SKLVMPRYQDLHAADMPVRIEGGAMVRVFSGGSGGVYARTLNHTPVTMIELVLEPGAAIVQDLPASYNGFIYLLHGRGLVGKDAVPAEESQVVWLERLAFDHEAQSEVTIMSEDEALRALLWAGEPLQEPVVHYGPFVMNSEQQIVEAFEDFHAGRF